QVAEDEGKSGALRRGAGGMAAYNTALASGALEMHEGTISHALLEESSACLEDLRVGVTTGKLQVTGKTLLNPKKDSKWERGRTRQVLHFGAHVRGGKAVGAEVCATT
ncbi:unnamed protein product, partial [Ectocarpus sp. 12 AP-2014]